MCPAGFRKAETFFNQRRIQENPDKHEVSGSNEGSTTFLRQLPVLTENDSSDRKSDITTQGDGQITYVLKFSSL